MGQDPADDSFGLQTIQVSIQPFFLRRLELDGGLLDGGEMLDVQLVVVGWIGQAADVILVGGDVIFHREKGG